MSARVYRYRTDEAVRVIVARAGRTKLSFVSIDVPVSVRRVPLDELRYMTALEDSDVRLVARAIRQAGKRLGITKGARKFLRGL